MQGSGPCDSSSNLLRATTNAAGRPRLRVREPSFSVRSLIFPRSFAVSRETLFSPCTEKSRGRREGFQLGGGNTSFAASRSSREMLSPPCTEGSREAAKSAKREREGTLQPSRLRALRVRHCSPNTKKSRETAKDARGNPGVWTKIQSRVKQPGAPWNPASPGILMVIAAPHTIER